MHDRQWVAVGMLVAATLVAGCSQTAGQARPGGTADATATAPSGSNPSGTTSATPTSALPARPRQVRMEAAGDPCALLTAEQQRTFGINRFLHDQDTGFGHPGCTFKVEAAEPFYGFTVTPKPDFDPRRLLTGEIRRWARVVTAASFPAVESRPSATRDGTNLSCFVNVDVADGQSLEVQSLLISTEAFTADEMCEKTRLVAEAVMITLLSRQ